jgi:FkbH-like protein
VKETAGRSPCSYIVGICPGFPATERRAFFEEMETLLASELQGIRNLCLIQSPEWRQMYPVTEFYDRHGDELGHIPYTAEFFTAMGTMLARKCFGLLNASYKVIVLDCDQTLWGGIRGEDGVMGITIDAGRQALQRFMLEQKSAGKLLCLCSKNNEADVAEVFDSRPEMCLKRDDIVAWRINWKSKSENLKSLAEELGLSLHDFIFMDDNPVECAEVEANCPEVLVLKVPSHPEAMNEFLRHVWVFDHRETTEEDRNRTELYRANSERERVRKAAPTFEAFLAGLGLSLKMKEPEPQQLARVAQLTQRTNQFNTTSVRRNEIEIEHLLRTRQLECIVVSASDRFGEYGLIGVMLFKAVPGAINVDTFLLSCRVLGKGIEHRMLAKMCEIACERELELVEIEYRPTGRNQPALYFFENLEGQSVKQRTHDHAFQLVARDFVSLRYNPGESTTMQHVSLIDNREHLATKPRSDTLTRIATELSQIGQIQSAVEARRRQPRGQSASEYVAPSTPYEKTLAEIWSTLLGVEQIGVFDDFFELGGHSLLATQLISHVREAFQVEVPLQIIFAPRFTIADLVKIVIQSQMEKINDEDIAALLDEISNTSNEEGKTAIPHAT